MVEIALGIFTLAVTGAVVTASMTLVALAGIAVVEWVKYRRGE